jgi:hypothetical protein
MNDIGLWVGFLSPALPSKLHIWKLIDWCHLNLIEIQFQRLMVCGCDKHSKSQKKIRFIFLKQLAVRYRWNFKDTITHSKFSRTIAQFLNFRSITFQFLSLRISLWIPINEKSHRIFKRWHNFSYYFFSRFL